MISYLKGFVCLQWVHLSLTPHSPGCLVGVESVDVLPQHHLSLVLQVLHLLWVFQSSGLWIPERFSKNTKG